MSEVKWIKIATDLFDDEKIMLLESMPDGDAIIVIWFKLLTLAGKQNNSGVFIFNDTIPYTEEMLATIFRRPVATVRLALKSFEQFGMIQIVENVITIPNWEKHQSLEKMEKLKLQNRERVKRCREKQKLLCNANVMITDHYGNAPDIDIDKDKDKCCSTDFLELLNIEEIEYLKTIYKDVYALLDEASEDASLKRKKVRKPLEYIIGYAENKQWLRSQT